MKINHHLKFITPAIALAALSLTTANADTLANWTFETSVPTTTGPFSPEGGLQTATAQASISGVGTISNPAGNGSGESFSANGWTVGGYFQLSVNTLGYQDVTLSWDQAGSNTGPSHFGLFYSVNGGSYIQTDISSPNYTVLASAGANAWGGTYNPLFTITYDLSSISALDNATTLSFRLVDADTVAITGGTVAAAGTDRIDNFSVSATPVPEPSSIALAALGGAACLMAIRRRR